MPKIEVAKKSLDALIGKTFSVEELENIFPAAKAELDGYNKEDNLLKVELNDTNRPDLWSTAGLGRQLSVYTGKKIPEYGFVKKQGAHADVKERVIKVDAGLKDIRPFICAFAVKGKGLDEEGLKDIIQTQEKLCWNYGRKRKSIAMGVYRSSLINYPVRYKAADPDKTAFVPLGLSESLSLRAICEKHPKGQEYGQIVKDFKAYPFLTDDKGEVLSFPPIINSARLGAVEVGDKELFVEMTGTDMPSLVMAANIVACDLADLGFEILPVKTEYPYETPFGKTVTTPMYIQQDITAKLPSVEKMLGVKISEAECVQCLARMGVKASASGGVITVTVPEYRNDFMHEADVIEDIMIGRGMNSFEPVMPSDFTVGRLSAQELYSRRVQDLMVGMGFQEMIFFYLGSAKTFISNMNLTQDKIIQISNPMSENYEFVRDSILPCLLQAEGESANAVFPHRIFETGKVAFMDDSDNSGSVTKNYCAWLMSDRQADFNAVASVVAALMYNLNLEYLPEETSDPRFISGRCAAVKVRGKKAGVFGEVHPAVLENFGITVPVVCAELDLDILKG